MKTYRYIDEDELLNRAINALMEKLGPVETGRFLSLAPQKRMESVKRHRLWQSELDKERFFAEVFGRRSA